MIEIVIILALIALNGVFAMSEIAVVSARKARLRLRAEDGNRDARAALALADDPSRFLSTVQIGITLVGVLAGAYGGVALAEDVAPWLARLPALVPYADEIAFVAVVVVITFLSLVVGELVPKHLGLRNPERVAMLVARPMRALSTAAGPVVALLTGSTALVLRLFGKHAPEGEPATEEEISFLLAEGARAGVFEAAEREIIERVFRFGDQPVAAVMTPRTDVEGVRLDETPERLREAVVAHPHTRLIVYGENLDDPVGIVHVKDLLAQLVRQGRMDLAPLVRQPPVVPESALALRVLERFKRTGEHLALVVNEYGGLEGVVTLHDILEGIVGDVPWASGQLEPSAVRREDGSWLVEGMMPIGEFKDLLGRRTLPGEELQGFHTLGGFVVAHLGHIPSAAEAFERDGLRFEVVDMDGRRVDKVLVAPVSTA